MTFNSNDFRAAMGRFATGITVVTYLIDGKAIGMTANAFMSVSLDPPLVLVSVRIQGSFVSAVREGDRYGISFLSHDQEQVSQHFGGKPIEAFEAELENFNGFPVIANAIGNLVVVAKDIHEAGDHLLYISEVEHLRYVENPRPILYFAGKYQRIEGLTVAD